MKCLIPINFLILSPPISSGVLLHGVHSELRSVVYCVYGFCLHSKKYLHFNRLKPNLNLK